MRKQFLAASFLLLLPLAAFAQDKPKVEVFGGYSYLNTDDSLDLDLHGWNASVTGNLNKWFGIKADFSGHYDDITLSPGVRADVNAHLFLVGPQFSYRKSDTWQPFAHVLLGAARSHISARTATGLQRSSETNFALAAGGGLDLNVAKHLAVRLFQADYVFVHDNIDDTHNFRLSTGLVLRLGDH